MEAATQVTHTYTNTSKHTHLHTDTHCQGDSAVLIGPGKQLVQYSATPVMMSEPITLGEGGADLPSLLELEAEPFLTSDPCADDPAAALLGHTHLDSDL